jgi:hypothetical protein
MAIQKTWTHEEVRHLEVYFHKTENHILAAQLNRSISSVAGKASSLGLIKDPDVAHQTRVSAGVRARQVSLARPQTYRKDGGIRFVKSLSGHPSFDEYRKVSQIYRMDLLLRKAVVLTRITYAVEFLSEIDLNNLPTSVAEGPCCGRLRNRSVA